MLPKIGSFLNPKGVPATHTLEPPSIMMHSLFHLHLASFASMQPVMWVMLVPIAVFVVMGIVAIVAIVMKNLEQERWHETARIALAKGVPVPSAPLASPSVNLPMTRHRQRMGLITGGLVNIAIGIGVYIGMSAIDAAREAHFFGLIPAFVGVALILGAVIDRLLTPTLPHPGDTAPKL
jgi:hypothetical protein